MLTGARLRQQWLEASAEIRTELLSGATDEDALALVAQRPWSSPVPTTP